MRHAERERKKWPLVDARTCAEIRQAQASSFMWESLPNRETAPDTRSSAMHAGDQKSVVHAGNSRGQPQSRKMSLWLSINRLESNEPNLHTGRTDRGETPLHKTATRLDVGVYSH